jgi:hypothetical protein
VRTASGTAASVENSRDRAGSAVPSERAKTPITIISNSPLNSIRVRTRLVLSDSEMPIKLMSESTITNKIATSTVGRLTNWAR